MLFLVIYVVLMSIGAGTAIPGGLFVPSILVRGRASNAALPPAPAPPLPARACECGAAAAGLWAGRAARAEARFRAPSRRPAPRPAASWARGCACGCPTGTSSPGCTASWPQPPASGACSGGGTRPTAPRLRQQCRAACLTPGQAFARAARPLLARAAAAHRQTNVTFITVLSPSCRNVCRNAISLVVLVMEGTRSIEYMGGIILSVSVRSVIRICALRQSGGCKRPARRSAAHAALRALLRGRCGVARHISRSHPLRQQPGTPLDPQVVVANWVAHQIHHEGVYESELERIGNLYFLRDEPPHRCAHSGFQEGTACLYRNAGRLLSRPGSSTQSPKHRPSFDARLSCCTAALRTSAGCTP